MGVCAKAMGIDENKYKNDIVLSFLFKFKLISQYVLTYLVLALYFLFLFYFSRLCVYKSERIHLSWRMNGNKENPVNPRPSAEAIRGELAGRLGEREFLPAVVGRSVLYKMF